MDFHARILGLLASLCFSTPAFTAAASFSQKKNGPSILPSYGQFGFLSQANKSSVLEALKNLIAKSETKKLSAVPNKFCVVGGYVSEISNSKTCTGPDEGCISGTACHPMWSDQSCAHRGANGIYRCYEKHPATAEVSRLQWLTYRRLVAAYCAVNADESCDEIASVERLKLRRHEPVAVLPEAKIKFFAFLMRIFEQTAWAVELCKYDAIEKSIVFSNGDKIYFDFGFHSGAGDFECLEDAFSNPKNAQVEIAQNVEGCLKRQQNYLASLSSRIETVSKVLQKDSRVRWLGIEEAFYDNQPGQRNEAEYKATLAERRSKMIALAKNHKLSDAQIKVIGESYVGCGAACSLFANDENIRKRYELLAVEDTSLAVSYAHDEAQIAKHWEELEQLKKEKKLSTEVLTKLGQILTATYNGHRPSTLAERQSVLALTSDTSAREKITKILDAEDGLQRRNDRREQKAIANIRAHGGSGILSYGEWHEPSITKKFEEACRAEMAGKSSSSEPLKSKTSRRKGAR